MIACPWPAGAKGERFLVSIIAIFLLVGIALGVATLIVVSSAMSGFQTELVNQQYVTERVHPHKNINQLLPKTPKPHIH
jgi:ABC-type lipoprotein release transport system permease subunit